mmetsp:Transcript_2683/g.6110  ORF Transcript_2683/g.6110 Transcript_2683/m.6110 type:complete len:83 (-) Transcript_2683:116-364(-)
MKVETSFPIRNSWKGLPFSVISPLLTQLSHLLQILSYSTDYPSYCRFRDPSERSYVPVDAWHDMVRTVFFSNERGGILSPSS